MAITRETVADAHAEWVRELGNCKRVANWSEHPSGSTLPVAGCKCGDCEQWNKANGLHDRFLALRDLYDAECKYKGLTDGMG